ncbi:hypothetical protein ANO14919_140520 [Xylariales sp. No.14919]|nr:hypothetical protein ANO14919_140520 [Xylariales sp. No.14919]
MPSRPASPPAFNYEPLTEDPDDAREFSCFECISRLARDPRAFCVEPEGNGARCRACYAMRHSCHTLARTTAMRDAFNDLYKTAMEYDSNDADTVEA